MKNSKPLNNKKEVFEVMMEQEGSCNGLSCAGNPKTGRNTVMCPFYELHDGRFGCKFFMSDIDRSMKLFYLEKLIHEE